MKASAAVPRDHASWPARGPVAQHHRARALHRRGHGEELARRGAAQARQGVDAGRRRDGGVEGPEDDAPRPATPISRSSSPGSANNVDFQPRLRPSTEFRRVALFHLARLLFAAALEQACGRGPVALTRPRDRLGTAATASGGERARYGNRLFDRRVRNASGGDPRCNTHASSRHEPSPLVNPWPGGNRAREDAIQPAAPAISGLARWSGGLGGVDAPTTQGADTHGGDVRRSRTAQD